MSFRSLRTTAERLKSDAGNALVTAILVSMTVGALAALGLNTATHADKSSASDRNHEIALGVAEAAVHHAIAKVAAASAGGDNTVFSLSAGETLPVECDTASTEPPQTCPQSQTAAGYNAVTPEGKYWYWITRTDAGFIIDAEAVAGNAQIDRARHVRVTLAPPTRFRTDEEYALFSKTSIDVQAGDQILDGDVYANQWINISNAGSVDPSVDGNVTSGTSWIRLQSGVHVTGNVWSGGPHALGAIRLDNGTEVDGWAKASSNVPGCTDQPHASYDVPMGPGSLIKRFLVTWGQQTGAGTVQEGVTAPSCTPAFVPPAFPRFTYSADNYGLLHEFDSLTAFNNWFAANKSDFRGAFRIRFDPLVDGTLSVANRVNLTGAVMTGPVTLITEAPPPSNPDGAGYGIPVSTENISDAGVTDYDSAVFVIVSHYKPPAGTTCSTEGTDSDCAVQIKNNFSTDAEGNCKTATLVYADNGPVAIKNSGKTCGSVVSNGIQVKNNLIVQYDKRIDRVAGFGPDTFDIARWEELPVG